MRSVAPTLEPMWHEAILYSTLHCKSVASGDLKFLKSLDRCVQKVSCESGLHHVLGSRVAGMRLWESL